MISITQFSSDLLFVKNQPSGPNAAIKNFTIKRIGDFKQNALYNTKKIIDIELKRKNKISRQSLK